MTTENRKREFADTETRVDVRKKAIFRKENHNRIHCPSPCRVTEQTVPQSHRGSPVSLQNFPRCGKAHMTPRKRLSGSTGKAQANHRIPHHTDTQRLGITAQKNYVFSSGESYGRKKGTLAKHAPHNYASSTYNVHIYTKTADNVE